ncbi:tripartite tricarboxylate transporter substrate binding protein [Alcaligenaceae bacterium LF4-65]|jgi:tripartite-type tricarboxylate transporter receptor subunit TctC|uniref:Tripartite tricarboxylate transporter substrate binding protein n=1 Tax=Zwartia hollandica TaxID=324606 RepID=A0A953NA99_9BURK|nr:tripartite tricarboxylate transporter substrate binding protein [Zwartia hollandica]MBZ1349590.1 tripartite tricarboxylate transporter substrate binding protein [Zwartia hollandica]
MKFLTMLAAAAVVGAPFASVAQDKWPVQNITFLVPFPPGGPTDIMARLLSTPLGAKLGTTVVVENRAGASGNIGSAAVARAKPDGYTILLATSGNMSVNQTLFKNLNYDPIKDFAPIIQISKFPLVLEVKADTPVKSLSEYLAFAKANPTKVSFGSAGNGTPQHLCPELIKKMTGASLQHVPYKGASPAVTDLLGGQIFSMCDIIVGSIKYIQGGQLRPIAVTTKTRAAILPDVPTMDESGLKGFDYFAWHGIVAPAKTPPAIVARYNTALNEIFSDPDFRKKWEAIGSEVIGGSASDFSALILSEADRLGALVKGLGVQLD